MDGTENPYVAAQRVWDDRYGGLARQRTLWQWVAAGQLVAVLVLAVALVTLRRQATRIPLSKDARFASYFLATFRQTARGIRRELPALTRSLAQGCPHARKTAKVFLTEYHGAPARCRMAQPVRVAPSGHRPPPVARSWPAGWIANQRCGHAHLPHQPRSVDAGAAPRTLPPDAAPEPDVLPPHSGGCL
jgi:hypothetical protein